MNEILLLLAGIISTAFVYISWRISEERLYTTIVVFLLLIATTGGKLAEFFGFETNTGNVFYAAAFLATYFLIERFGPAKGIRSIWIAVTIVVFFTVLVQIAILYESATGTEHYHEALRTIAGDSMRITLASLLAFIVAQSFNVHFYTYLRERLQGAHIWLRANVTNALAQIVDSAIFFFLAFSGAVAPENLWEIIIAGIVIKIAYMMGAGFLLALNTFEHNDGEEYSTVTVR